MYRKTIIMTIIAMTLLSSCKQKGKEEAVETKQTEDFKFLVEQFADLRIMRYQVTGFEELSLQQKELVYYLSEAALCGRDIFFDQNYKYNLLIRNTLDNIVENYTGDKTSKDYENFLIYTKRVWFSNGIHHHYSSEKFFPEISQEYFAELVKNSKNAKFSLMEGENIDQFIGRVSPYIFDPNVAPKKVVQDDGVDLVKSSAVNFYEGVTQKEVEAYYAKLRNPKDSKPISLGLNSKLVKKDGKVTELVYSENGLYGEAITKIIYWLDKAAGVAENAQQKAHIEKLIEYYKTGDLRTWDAYNVLWVEDVSSHTDFVNGFIETYDDPMGMKATWESVVNFKDIEATKRTEIISSNAQWFEDHSPVDPKFKKKKVKGVTAKVITVAQLGGACYPTTPIGINLPNANWIRKDHGSKSVTMENITYAYAQASLGGGVLEEFCYSEAEIELSKKHGALADNLHTDMHECLGHGSGQLLPGVSDDALKNYSSPLEECRADLFALYFMMDNKMIELGLMESLDVAKAAYDKYIRNGIMMQLTRIELGKNIEQAHMRNRAIIARWCYEKGKDENVIEKKTKDGKTYFVINDYEKLRELFGVLLSEIQRIKSTGDFKAGKELVENYGVKIDPEFHKEILERYSKLKVAPYGGFINPQFVPVEKDGKIVDIKVEYPDDFTKQMLDYSKKYSFLPIKNN